MITKIMGEAPFQVLTNNFSISPSNEGYTLQISADGKNYSNLFQVGANVTRLVTGVAANSYYRLLGNDSEVSINWMKTCVTEGGGSGSGVTPEEVQAQIDSALTVYTPTANFATINGSAITSGGNLVIEFEDKTLIDFDRTTQAERADLYTTLKALYDGGSGATINKTYDFYKTVGTKQGLKIDYYGFSGNTLIFGKVVSPDNPEDQVAYAQVMTIQSDGSVSVVSNVVGGVSAEDFNFISGRVQTNEQVVSEALNDLNDRIEEISGNTGGGGDSTILSPREEFPLDAETGSVVAKVKPNIILEWTAPTLDDNYYLGKINIDKLYADLDSASTYNLGTFTRLNEGVEQTVKMVLWYNYQPQYSIDSWALLVLDENVEPVPSGDFPFIEIFDLQNDGFGNFSFYYQDETRDDGHFEFAGGNYAQDGIGELWLYITDENGDDYTIQSGFEPELEGIDGGLVADGVYQFNGEDWKQIGESESGGDMTTLKGKEVGVIPSSGNLGDIISLIALFEGEWNTEDETTAKMHMVLDGLDKNTHYTIAEFTDGQGRTYAWRLDYEGTWIARIYRNGVDYTSLFLGEDDDHYNGRDYRNISITTDLETEEDTYAQILWIEDDYTDLGGMMLQFGVTNGNQGEWIGSYEDIPDLALTDFEGTDYAQGPFIWNGSEWEPVVKPLNTDAIWNVLGPDIDNLWMNFDNYTPTENFATINGSAITEGGDIVVGGSDMSNYWTSAQTESAITSKNYVTSAQVETQIVEKNYITSAATQDMVTSTSVSTIWKGTQQEYNAIVTKDPATLYIIIE